MFEGLSSEEAEGVYLSRAVSARVAGVREEAVLRWIHSGRLPVLEVKAAPPGRKVLKMLVRYSDLAEFLERRRRRQDAHGIRAVL